MGSERTKHRDAQRLRFLEHDRGRRRSLGRLVRDHDGSFGQVIPGKPLADILGRADHTLRVAEEPLMLLAPGNDILGAA
jgi:hypothetical protein